MLVEALAVGTGARDRKQTSARSEAGRRTAWTRPPPTRRRGAWEPGGPTNSPPIHRYPARRRPGRTVPSATSTSGSGADPPLQSAAAIATPGPSRTLARTAGPRSALAEGRGCEAAGTAPGSQRSPGPVLRSLAPGAGPPMRSSCQPAAPTCGVSLAKVMGVRSRSAILSARSKKMRFAHRAVNQRSVVNPRSKGRSVSRPRVLRESGGRAGLVGPIESGSILIATQT